ncbi:MAG: heme exporter protein CcmB [Gammaproteobacteria bacterium]|nr:heme exporter protein CcmB [Gammaproteobacteria bacterium]
MSAGLMHAFVAVLRRDLLLALRRRGDSLNPLLFFVLAVTLFPLGIGPEPQRLAEVAPGVLWVAALLATLLSLDSLFRADHEDGALEQLMLMPQPLSVLVLAKILAHWLVSGLPLLLMSPLLGVVLHLPEASFGALFLGLALGTPVLSLVGAIGAALTVGLRRGGMLLSLLVLPLYVPVLIFGAGAVAQAGMGLSYAGQLAMLGALLALSLSLAPLACAAALRVTEN